MNLESFAIAPSEGLWKLAELAKEMPGKCMDVAQLDRPVALELALDGREIRPPMSTETREKLEGKGFPSAILDAISSEAEAGIYDNAPLEAAEVNGKDTLVRTDINLEQKDINGRTNLERMELGRAPLDENQKPIELHHIGQKNESPLAELSKEEHCGNGNDIILHDKKKESEIDRTGFIGEREAHWKMRAAELIYQKENA